MEEKKYVDPAESARELCLERFKAADPEGYEAFISAEKKATEKAEKQAEKKATEKQFLGAGKLAPSGAFCLSAINERSKINNLERDLVVYTIEYGQLQLG